MPTGTMAVMAAKKKEPEERSAKRKAAVELVRMSERQGLALTESDSLLK